MRTWRVKITYRNHLGYEQMEEWRGKATGLMDAIGKATAELKYLPMVVLEAHARNISDSVSGPDYQYPEEKAE